MANTDDGDRTECLPSHVLKLPSEDWEFNIFLDDLAANITDDELERLKNYVSGDGGLGLGILEQINTPLELFKILKKRMIVSKDNLIFLQGMLWHLKNKELHAKAVEYARNVGNTLYFYAPSDKPENGYKYVKFHVQGKDFSKIKRRDLEQLRTIVSHVVMIPPQFVLISGLEPSSSFIITCMMPDYYVSLLVEILGKKNIYDLAELGIDSVLIDGKTISLSGTDEFEVLQSPEEQTLAKTFARLQFVEQQLEQRDIECLKLSRELEICKQKLSQAGLNKQKNDWMDVLGRQHLSENETLNPMSGKVASLMTQSALANFRFSLKKIKDLSYDTDVILNLLQANSFLVDIRVRATFTSIIKHMMTDIDQQKNVIASQQHTNQLLQFVSRSNPHESVMILLSQLWNIAQVFSFHKVISVNIPVAAIQILRKYSHLLNKKEKQILRKFHNWSREEICHVDNNPVIFLEMLIIKESQRVGGSINLANYLPSLLEEIYQKDLAKKCMEDFRRLENEQRRQNMEAAAHRVQPHSKKLNEQQQSQQLDEINIRLQNMEKMIKELKDRRAEFPDRLKDYIYQTSMPLWDSKYLSLLKGQRDSENSQSLGEQF